MAARAGRVIPSRRRRSDRRLRPVATAVAVAGVGVTLALGLGACGDTSGNSSGALTLRGTFTIPPDSLDPALSFTAEGATALQNTYIPLLTYAHANGPAGTRLIP